MSKRARLAQLCREERDAAWNNCDYQAAGVTVDSMERVITRCATLLGVLALLLDDEQPSQNGRTLYTREGRAFVKVKR